MPNLVFVTGNANKLKEFLAIMSDGSGADSVSVGKYTISSKSLDLVEVQGTVDEVTIAKTTQAVKEIGGPVLVEDVCLVFNAFNGLPGPYIKWFLKSMGPEKVHDMLYKFEDKSAKAICTFGYCAGPGEPVQLFQGVTEGTIVSPRGPQTFGWDCIFEPKGYSETYAEMDKKVKNTISHRSKALDKLKVFLKQ